jgi:hypothetical protein
VQYNACIASTRDLCPSGPTFPLAPHTIKGQILFVKPNICLDCYILSQPINLPCTGIFVLNKQFSCDLVIDTPPENLPALCYTLFQDKNWIFSALKTMTIESLWRNCKDTYRRWLRVEVDSLIINEIFEPEKTISYALRRLLFCGEQNHDEETTNKLLFDHFTSSYIDLRFNGIKRTWLCCCGNRRRSSIS